LIQTTEYSNKLRDNIKHFSFHPGNLKDQSNQIFQEDQQKTKRKVAFQVDEIKQNASPSLNQIKPS
jgi:hypothetical protein